MKCIMKIKLGIAPIAWSNDDMPELGGTTSVEQCIQEAKKAGYSGIELGGKFPRNPNIVKYLLDFYKIKMPGGWYGSKLRERSVEAEWKIMQDQISLLKLVNASVFVFADVSGSIQSVKSRRLSSRPKLKKNEWSGFCKKISEISKRLDDVGLPISYHPHMGTIIQNEDDIDRLLNYTNNKTNLLFDTGHLMFANADYNIILNKYIERVNHVHCKDIRKNILNIAIKKNLSFPNAFLKGIFTVPGDGCINYKPIFETLKKNKYKKWLVVEAEQNPNLANPFRYAKIGFKYLETNLKINGYKI